MKRRKYNNGCVVRIRRKKGDHWVFRYRQLLPGGETKNVAVVIGTVAELPTRSSAQKATEHLRVSINCDNPMRHKPITMNTLIDRYLVEEAPLVAVSTRSSYI